MQVRRRSAHRTSRQTQPPHSHKKSRATHALLFHSRTLTLVHLNKVLHNLHQLFISHGSRVQTEIIVSRIIPVLPGIIFILIRTVLIDLFDLILRIPPGNSVMLHYTDDTIFLRCKEKQTEHIRIIL